MHLDNNSVKCVTQSYVVRVSVFLFVTVKGTASGLTHVRSGN